MCNLKSNKDLRSILDYKKEISKINFSNSNFILFPSFLHLGFFYHVPYAIGAQDVSIYKEGDHTSEILASQLKTLHVEYVLINHCELNNDNLMIIQKIHNAVASNLKVVLCISETMEETEEETIAEIKEFITKIFAKLTNEEQQNIILAYEPCYLIHQEATMAPEKITKMITKIKEYCQTNYQLAIEVVYGGSVNCTNIDNLLAIDIIDGFLIGKCTNNPENLVKIVKKMQKATLVDTSLQR